jgi:GPH family glycoside/pentoside/hexuronide:cation symporter
MVVMAVFAMLLIIATTLNVKERKEFTQVDKPLALWQSIKYTFASKAFRSLVPANFMTTMMQALVLGAMLYLTDYVLQTDFKILVAALFFPLVIGIPLTTVIRRRFGVVGAEQLLLVIAGVGFVLIAVVPPALVLACFVLAGFGVSGPQTLSNLLIAQVVDEDELRSGVRREGSFLGINALITKPAQSLALALTTFILTQAHFVTRAANAGQVFLDQPASAILGIKLIVGLIPGIAMFAGAAVLQFYPLRGAYLAKVQKEVLELHARKHAALEKQGKGEAVPAAGGGLSELDL